MPAEETLKTGIFKGNYFLKSEPREDPDDDGREVKRRRLDQNSTNS
jgi:hypothetical protein